LRSGFLQTIKKNVHIRKNCKDDNDDELYQLIEPLIDWYDDMEAEDALDKL